jgi:hypothetical protein
LSEKKKKELEGRKPPGDLEVERITNLNLGEIGCWCGLGSSGSG